MVTIVWAIAWKWATMVRMGNKGNNGNNCVGNCLEMGNNSILSENMNNAVNEEYKNYQINIWCKLGTDKKETWRPVDDLASLKILMMRAIRNTSKSFKWKQNIYSFFWKSLKIYDGIILLEWFWTFRQSWFLLPHREASLALLSFRFRLDPLWLPLGRDFPREMLMIESDCNGSLLLLL